MHSSFEDESNRDARSKRLGSTVTETRSALKDEGDSVLGADGEVICGWNHETPKFPPRQWEGQRPLSTVKLGRPMM